MKILAPFVVFLYSGLGAMLGMVMIHGAQRSFLRSGLASDDYAGQLAVSRLPLAGGSWLLVAGCFGVVIAYFIFRATEKL